MYAPNKLQILVVVEKKLGSDPLFTESDDGFPMTYLLSIVILQFRNDFGFAGISMIKLSSVFPGKEKEFE